MKAETQASIIATLENKAGQTTSEISKILKLSRSATSIYLNELLGKKILKQEGKKPVLWSINQIDVTEDLIFERFIGSDGSALRAINHAKAAVLYPPMGLPLLIHGNSGVGKSFLAQLIFEHLQSQQVDGADNIFILNCADYANNPELLSSVLFGYTKGAFTGADSAKKGLLEEANNSILFLDEVHRLSYENQEKLFQFMDKGYFSPIGENASVIYSKVRLLFATTEDPQRVLLSTFYRRISVTIELPDFHDRPQQERAELIDVLFQHEALRIGRTIYLDASIFSQLIERKFSGNVGSLLNEIRMLCAKSLLNSLSGDLYISDATESESSHWRQINGKTNNKSKATYRSKIYQELIGILFVDEPLKKRQQKLEKYVEASLQDGVTIPDSPLVLVASDKIQQKSISILGSELLSVEQIRVSMFLAPILSLQEEFEGDVLIQTLKENYPRTWLFTGRLVRRIALENQEWLHLLLAMLLIGKITEEIKYQALVVAHGESTASSIQAVANKLSSNYIFDAIDMPLNASISDIVHEMKKWLSERNTLEGVIMLVDMGSLTQLYKRLKPQIQGELLVINNLTTSYALEIGQQLLAKESFFQIAKKAERNFKTDIQYFEGFSIEKNIIIASISGRDVAKNLKQIFKKYVEADIKIIVLDYNELVKLFERESSEEGYLKETSTILTTSYLTTKTNVNSINLLDALDQDSKKIESDFLTMIHPNNLGHLLGDLIKFFSKEGLSEKLEFLNPDIIIRQVEDSIEKCERRFELLFSPKMKFNLMMHLALMIERTILGDEAYPLPEELEKLMINNKIFLQNIKSVIYNLEQFYRIQVSDWELYILYEIIKNN